MQQRCFVGHTTHTQSRECENISRTRLIGPREAGCALAHRGHSAAASAQQPRFAAAVRRLLAVDLEPVVWRARPRQVRRPNFEADRAAVLRLTSTVSHARWTATTGALLCVPLISALSCSGQQAGACVSLGLTRQGCGTLPGVGARARAQVARWGVASQGSWRAGERRGWAVGGVGVHERRRGRAGSGEGRRG